MISQSNPGLYIPFSPADNKWNPVLLDGAMAPEQNNAHPFKKPWDLPPLWTGKTLTILPLNLIKGSASNFTKRNEYGHSSIQSWPINPVSLN